VRTWPNRGYADGEQLVGYQQANQVVHLRTQLRHRVCGGHRNRQREALGPPAPEGANGSPDGPSGSDAVIDDDDGCSGQLRRPAIAPKSAYAVDHLVHERVGALPVVNRDRRLVGVVSCMDVIRAVA
jgi:hypothetical protein